MLTDQRQAPVNTNHLTTQRAASAQHGQDNKPRCHGGRLRYPAGFPASHSVTHPQYARLKARIHFPAAPVKPHRQNPLHYRHQW